MNKRIKKIMLRRKIVEIVSVVLLIVSFLFILGTIGACECDLISIKRMLLQFIIGFIVSGIGFGGLHILNITE